MSTRERIIEGTWNCTSCETRDIKARHKSCPSCNNPRESGKESDFDFGGTTASGASTLQTVTDDKALDLANAGADWFCHYCGTGNRGDKAQCRNCGAQRDGTEKSLPDEEASKAPPSPAAFAAKQPKARRPPPPPPVAEKPRSRLWLYVASGVVMLCFFVFWATRTHEANGRVAGKSWTRIVHREVFSRVTKRGWQDSLYPSRAVMPVNGGGGSGGVEDIRDCSRRQRGTRQVADGTERVCRTKTRREKCGTEEKCEVKKLKNGFAKETCRDVARYCDKSYQDCRTETRYRSEPVYGTECAYTTWEWVSADSPRLSGEGDSPRWPEVRAGPLDRFSREEKYTVRLGFESDGEERTHELHPTSEREYLRWRTGTPV
ncbi:MAG TPA: hypothetical protein VK447_19185, partial [Myxococcaceae bacterium]|nr:hypothetical protein [Myxococcaceae bacterium]